MRTRWQQGRVQPSEGSGDGYKLDAFLVLLGGVMTVRLVGRWFMAVSGPWPAARSATSRLLRRVIALLPLVLGVGLWAALSTAASGEGRAPGIVLLSWQLGIVCLAVTLEGLAWLGVGTLQDGVVRENVGAGCAGSCAVIGCAICYAFAHFGQGDAIGTLCKAVFGVISCGVLWALHQLLSGAADAIAIERDLAAGLRFGGMSLGSSMMVGHALVQPLWVAQARLLAAPLALVLLAVVLQRGLARRAGVSSTGVVPSLAYVALGIAHVIWL